MGVGSGDYSVDMRDKDQTDTHCYLLHSIVNPTTQLLISVAVVKCYNN